MKKDNISDINTASGKEATVSQTADIKKKPGFKARLLSMSVKSKAIISVVIVLIAVCAVLSTMKPSYEELRGHVSPSFVEEVEKKSQNTTVYTITENDLFIVNLLRYEKTSSPAKVETYLGFAGHVFSANEGFSKTVGNLLNYTYRMLGVKENILNGAKLTIFLTSTSVAAGLILSVFLALGKISKFKPISKLCSAYIFFFRGTPLMIQLFVVFYAVPGVFQNFTWGGFFGDDPDSYMKGAFVAAFIAFSLNSAAYCAEIVRAAILSIDKGQHEAAKALGMSYSQTMGNIIIPQSIGRLIPPVANEFIMILKDASLVFTIGLLDITTISKKISSTGDYSVFIPALVIYLIITAFFSYIFNLLEKKFSKYL